MPRASRPRLAILASGRGSNAVALMEAFTSGDLAADLGLVPSNVAAAPVLEKAKSRGVPTAVVPSKGLSREAHEERVLAVLAEAGIDHILLAGYMRILGNTFLSRFSGSILNIHPSLLPEFPGLR